MMNELPFAVVIVAPTDEGLIAATTRPNEPGRIGLPGGKVDPGETPLEALRRECHEEGWDVKIHDAAEPQHADYLDGKLVWWYVTDHIAAPMETYKDQHRMLTIAVPYEAIANAGYGNEWLLAHDFESLFESNRIKFS